MEQRYCPDYKTNKKFIYIESKCLFQAVWLISGSDYKIHVIIEDKNTHGYAETRLEKYFPELEDLQSIALWIDIYYIDNYKRYVKRKDKITQQHIKVYLKKKKEYKQSGYI